MFAMFLQGVTEQTFDRHIRKWDSLNTLYFQIYKSKPKQVTLLSDLVQYSPATTTFSN